MGELKVGDQVFAVDGSIANITYVSPIELAEDSFAVAFDSGEIIECDGEHLWKTMTDKERVSVLRLNDEFREKRKINRPSRAKKFKKNRGSSINVTRMNKERVYEYLDPPDGQVRTTYEILETLFVRENRVNHSVAICEPLQIPKDDFVYDPYLVGMFLGDGCSTSGTIGCLEEDMNEMLQHVKVKEYSKRDDPRKQKQFTIVRFKNFLPFLKRMNLYKNKHIPISYLRTSIEDRVELLRGLMDTDGTCNANGRCNISLSNKRLIDDVRELVSSLGIKSSISIKKVKGYGDSYCLHFRPQFPVFHLSRKLERQNLTLSKKVGQSSLRRYITSVYPIEPKLMRCIAIDHPSHLYLAGKTLIPTHNTFGLLLEASRNISNPDYGGVIFRREQTMITNEGGLRDTALQLYPHLGGEYRSQPYPHFLFPSGARISFRHLNQESDVLSWQGSQIPFIGYDELTHFTNFQWVYMFSRLRSTSGVRPYIRATTNPDAESWVADLLEWWIDQDSGSPTYGLPIPERSGVIRYFVRINNELMWADSPEELVSRHGCDYLDAKSFTFIPAKITDNPILMKKDPAYLANLKALTRVERARLLDGNWKVRPKAGDYFPRDAITVIDWRPTDVVKWIRSWDLAATEDGDGRDPDWTVGLLVGRRSNGKIVVADMIRVRRKAAVIESLVKTIAARDGKDTWILLPQDPGQSGKSQKESFVGALYDFTVLSRTITKNKVAIASGGANSPASLWQQGQIEIVRAPWNNDFVDEMDAFPTKGVHDDCTDAFSTCVRQLPGHSKPDYSQSGLSGTYRPLVGQERHLSKKRKY